MLGCGILVEIALISSPLGEGMGAVSSKAERPGRWGEVKKQKLKRQL